MFRFEFKCLLGLAFLISASSKTEAQQFVGLGNPITSIQLLPYNPAYVNNSALGTMEVNVLSASFLGGNNMYGGQRGWLTQVVTGKDIEGVEGAQFFKKENKQIKRVWTNIDVVGPGVSWGMKNGYHVGVFTRFRTIVRAGGVTSSAFDTLSVDALQQNRHTMSYHNSGASAHAFSEVGVSVGKLLQKGDMYELKGGVSIKYVSGFAALSLQTPYLAYERKGDSLFSASGEANIFYTHNDPRTIVNGLDSNPGFGIDVGVQYFRYNKGVEELDEDETRTYKWSVAASITDIGGIFYSGSAGSGRYNVHLNNRNATDFELQNTDEQTINYYLNKQSVQNVITLEEAYPQRFMSLPTALRLSTDYNVKSYLNVSFNALVNLSPNTAGVYNAHYVGYVNLTPRVSLTPSMYVGMPVTLIRYRDLSVGTVVYMGPFFIGSTSAITSGIINKSVSNIDAYTGLAFTIHPKEREPRQARSKTKYYKSFKNVFKRKGTKGIACPPKNKW